MADAGLRKLGKFIFGLRIKPTRLHRVMAQQHQLIRLGVYELQRIFYYQPLFEALCAEVGDGVRLELCPDSKLPMVHNVEVRIGEQVRLSARSSFSGARNSPSKPVIEIGDHSYLGHRAVLRAGTSIRIGRYVNIATNALLTSDPGHPLDAQARRSQAAPAESLGNIVIEDDAWLAYNVTVVGNVRIGRGAVVAANAVVTRDVPAFALVAGNPAKVVRMLDAGEQVAVPSAQGETQILVDRPIDSAAAPTVS